jgi:CubicO group peptidase (beta-lactamase class C family)
LRDYIPTARIAFFVIGFSGGKGCGLANIKLDVVNRPETKFRPGSITKQFTATAILRSQEKGKLRVADLISKYLPGTPAAWSRITIRRKFHYDNSGYFLPGVIFEQVRA